MKILQLIYSLCSGGAEKFVVNLSNALAGMGHDVTVCILLNDEVPGMVFNKQHLCGKVRFKSLKFDPGFSLKKEREVYSYLSAEKPDIVHCHLNVIPYIFRYALFHSDVKIFHTIHNVAENAAGKSWQKNINRWFYKRLITPVTISRLCQESFERYYRMKNVIRVDNGCPPIAPTANFNSVEAEVNNYKTSPDSKVFIHVARCDPQKNQGLLIDSFNRLDSEGAEFTLIILGSAFNSPEGEELQKRACAKIHFLGPKNNVGDYLLCSDAFCLTSIYEGLPISLIEALSAGLTPICTPAGGIPDVITDGETGYLAKDITVKAYSEAIRKFLAKPLNHQTLISYYDENYSMEICAKSYESIMKQKALS